MNRLSSSGTMHLCLAFLQTRLLTLSYTGRIVSPQLGAEQMTILMEYSLAEQVFIEKHVGCRNVPRQPQRCLGTHHAL